MHSEPMHSEHYWAYRHVAFLTTLCHTTKATAFVAPLARLTLVRFNFQLIATRTNEVQRCKWDTVSAEAYPSIHGNCWIKTAYLTGSELIWLGRRRSLSLLLGYLASTAQVTTKAAKRALDLSVSRKLTGGTFEVKAHNQAARLRKKGRSPWYKTPAVGWWADLLSSLRRGPWTPTSPPRRQP